MEKESSEQLNTFFSKYPSSTYNKKEMILRADDPVFAIYLLKKGLVRQYVITPEGEEVTIHIFEPLSFFPIMTVISDVENRFNFEASTNVEVKKAPPKETLKFLKGDQAVLFDLTVRFARAIDGLTRRVEILARSKASHKVIAIIIYLAEKFGKTDGVVTLIDLPLTHGDIAHWVGDSRETVSRQMERLAKARIISYQGHLITILNPAKLLSQLHDYS